MIKVVCALIENTKGEILLVQRSAQMPHALAWEFPGGKVQEGESETEALHRELTEELGIRVHFARKGKAIQHQYATKSILLIPFFCSLKAGSVHLREHAAMCWLKADALAAQTDLLEADLKLLKANGWT